MKMLRADPQEIARSIATLYRPQDVIELRIPKGQGADSGYFNQPDTLLKALTAANGASLYVTLNPVQGALLARSANHIRVRAKTTTSDRDVLHRRWLLVDFDPERPADISSTDAEHEAAIESARNVRFHLAEEGWPAPILADSGNGAHLLYHLDLPNDEPSKKLLEAVLKALAARFNDAQVHIDETVFNAARIVKAYGTVTRKGDNIPERPHRLSKLLEVPTKIELVSRALLEELAGAYKQQQPQRTSLPRYGQFDIEAFIAAHLRSRAPVAHEGGRKWVLEECPFNGDHKAPDSAIFEHADGSLGFKCFHAACSGKSWRDVRELFEGPRPWTNGQPPVPVTTPLPERHESKTDEQETPGVVPWPEPIGEIGMSGLAGEFVHLVEEHTEADPNILLLTFLVYAGNLMGRNFYSVAGGDIHCANLYLSVVGTTSHGRKGSALSVVEAFFLRGDRAPGTGNLLRGISSGEGLIWQIRDPIIRPRRDSRSGKIEQVVEDAGIEDKRLLVSLGEFYQCLAAMRRKDNSLSSILRTGWDKDIMHSPVKNSDAKATGAHLSIVACISKDELLRAIDTGDSDNGTLNRFLWACSKRSRLLPEGGKLYKLIESAEWKELQSKFNRNLGNASNERFHFLRDREASTDWGFDSNPQHGVYAKLTEQRTGMWGSITARAAAQVLRLSLAEAVINGARQITREHQDATRDRWRYCEQSARYIFGDRLDDPIAQAIIGALRHAGAAGMTRKEVVDFLQRNKPGPEIQQALISLSQAGLARCEKQSSTGGRPAEKWFAL